MKLNESVAISTPLALLVPYDSRHVEKYHAWMEDPAIQEATASEPLTLAEEYENQASWRASHDKLTFVVCKPLVSVLASLTSAAEWGRRERTPSLDSCLPISILHAGEHDAPDKMVGDVNFFLYPDEDTTEADVAEEDSNDQGGFRSRCVVGEIDIMIAAAQDRGKGVGRCVVASFLHYLWRHKDEMLGEYYNEGHDDKRHRTRGAELTMIMAKIKEGNQVSIALFKSLGFEQEGGVNYFGEVKMVLRNWAKNMVAASVPEGYAELVYRREI